MKAMIKIEIESQEELYDLLNRFADIPMFEDEPEEDTPQEEAKPLDPEPKKPHVEDPGVKIPPKIGTEKKPRKKVDKDMVKVLYMKQGWTKAKIAKELGVTPGAIW